MDLQEMIDNASDAMRAKRMKTSPQLTVVEITLKLEGVEKQDADVVFDFEYAHPTNLESWRGSYAELAFGFEFEGDRPTVKKVLENLRGCIGKTYTGYKGGDFVMGKATPVWVANYGNSGNTAVVGVRDEGYEVILETRYCEY